MPGLAIHGFHADTVLAGFRQLPGFFQGKGNGGIRASVQDIPSDPAVISTEELPEGRRALPGSVAFVPSVAGLIIAGEVIKDLIR